MSNEIERFESGMSPFDAIAQRDDRGEFWSARDLQPMLGYETWRRFEDTIERAILACENSALDVAAHFADSVNMDLGPKTVADYRLTRYACYMVAMNGDPHKPRIAAAQTYFAIKTREAETAAPQTYPQALRALADQVEQAARLEQAIHAQQHRIKELEPQAKKFRQWQVSEDTVYVVEWAKTLGLTQAEAFALLRHEGVLFKQRMDGAQGPAFNVPKRGYEHYFDLVDERLPNGHWVKVPKITPDGQVDLAQLLVDRGHINPPETEE
ncbi:MAG TPA: phage antirepressor KilAC domain-containing protein [Mycobacterium sp.]|nr:phage antirepressor KilAC domain-containing protein [Mycobacterium sp.]